MALDAAKPLRKRLGVAVLAARADFRAAADGVPGGVRPFDLGVQGHVAERLSSELVEDVFHNVFGSPFCEAKKR